MHAVYQFDVVTSTFNRMILLFLQFLKTVFRMPPVRQSSSFVGVANFRRSLQRDDYTCGTRCVHMILRHHGKLMPFGTLKRVLRTNPDHGTAIEPMVSLLRKKGFRVGYRPRINMRELRASLRNGAVAIVHLDGDHLAVVHGMDDSYVYVADPSFYRMPRNRHTHDRFKERWGNWALLVTAV
jgi:ABC-type bacteriocin/lantibiotic exporter with double-glycine peptidase domain